MDLDFGNCSFCCPVNIDVWDRFFVKNGLDLLIIVWDDHVRKDHCLELFFGINGELVNSFLVGLSRIGIVGKNAFEIFSEDQSTIGFLIRGESGSKLLFPLRELINGDIGEGNLKNA